MDDLNIARALHVLAVVHWIGGVSLVTFALLPGLLRSAQAQLQLGLFEAIEHRFAWQARFSTVIAGGTGFYMMQRLAAWDRLVDPRFWWMHLMVLVWAIFTFVLFVAEPLFLDRWFRKLAARDSEGAFRLAFRLHAFLLLLSAVTIAGAVLGAHGALH